MLEAMGEKIHISATFTTGKETVTRFQEVGLLKHRQQQNFKGMQTLSYVGGYYLFWRM